MHCLLSMQRRHLSRGFIVQKAGNTELFICYLFGIKPIKTNSWKIQIYELLKVTLWHKTCDAVSVDFMNTYSIYYSYGRQKSNNKRSLASNQAVNTKPEGTFTLCPCQNQFQYPLQFPCPSHRLHWIRIPVSFRLNFMSTTTSPDVKVWFCIGTCKIRMETDVRISFSRSGDRSKRNGR